MQAIHETETYLSDSEFNEESYSDERPAPTGARRVMRLALILLVLILATAVFLFVLMPMIQAMIQPPIPLAPALQV